MKISRGLVLCLFIATTSFADWNFGWEGNEGGAWSGSDPQEFVVGTKPCDFKVRGRSGVWSDFKGDMSPGKIVIGVANPREPDIIFFQLKKQSPFLFAAKRTCFQGETPYVEDALEAAKNKKLKYPLGFFSYWYIRNSERVSSTEVITTVTNMGCLGGGKEWVDSFYRIYLGACLGFGGYNFSSSRTGVDTDFDGKHTYALPIYLGGFYDLPETPYAAGLELTAGFAMSTISPVGEGDGVTETDFFWSLGMAWRVYYENWMFVPKFGIYDGFHPKFFEFQIGYLFQ